MDMPITLDDGLRSAARIAVDTWITKKTRIVGIGSGPAMIYVIERIAELVFLSGKNEDIVCIPSSFVARHQILDNNLTLGDLTRYPNVDVVFDSANDIDYHLSIIKGSGGNMLQEKIVASCSKNLVIIVDCTKYSARLGEHCFTGVPIEVLPVAFYSIKQLIETMYGGRCELRLGQEKLGPLNTDNGNFLVDWFFDTSITYNWYQVNYNIKLIPGVMETGLFVNMAQIVYIAMIDGSVQTRSRDSPPGPLKIIK